VVAIGNKDFRDDGWIRESAHLASGRQSRFVEHPIISTTWVVITVSDLSGKTKALTKMWPARGNGMGHRNEQDLVHGDDTGSSRWLHAVT